MPKMPICPSCGAPLPADAPEGLCPHCLLRGILGESTISAKNLVIDATIPGLAELTRLFPQLEILELLGRGGMGAVFKARQPGLNRLVALKILPPDAGRDPAFAERFIREAQALARLSHPHIIAVHDFGQVGGLYYLLMEYVDGQDLRRHMQDVSMSALQALQLAAQVCEALEYAHEEGIVHRDIKPENILLDRKERVKIADFGLAKLLNPSRREVGLTSSHQVMGTLHYMAPEQMERPLEVDGRADLYSLGVVLYEQLTGELPLGNFKLPSQKVAVGGRVDDIVLRSLAKEPDRRYQHARDMHCALESAVQVIQAGPAMSESSNAKKEDESDRISRYRWLIPIAGVVALAAIVTALAWKYFGAISTSNALRWGGDASGGAPYIIDQGSDKSPTGFEAELAAYLASRMGLKDQFVQKSWEALPQELGSRHDIDLILNGYEWTPEREQVMASTIPYYVYKLQLIARRNDTSIRNWEDLRLKPGHRKKKVGVLENSAAAKYLEKNFADDLEVVALGEEGTTGVMLKVQGSSLDATVQDLPASIYYIVQKNEFKELCFVGEPIKPFEHSYYVIYVRAKDSALRERLNDGLSAAIQDGTLRRIYERYGLWNPDQEELAQLARNWPPQVAATQMNVYDSAVLLGKAALTTILLACLSMPLAMLVGLLVAVGRLYGPSWLDWVLGVYVEVLRGTPLLLQLWVIYFFLASLEIGGISLQLPAFYAGVLGLAINYSAYEAENYRAGLLAIPRGQMEASLSLGMSTWTALRRVIIPQAVRIVIPPVTNDFIALFKDTSVCSVISVVELTGRYRSLSTNYPLDAVVIALLTATLYLLMSYPLSLLARRLERRFPKGIV